MSSLLLQVRELIAWPLDRYERHTALLHDRVIARAFEQLHSDNAYEAATALIPHETEEHRATFNLNAERLDLLEEMAGLTWSFGVVDLHKLLAFQRRLTFHPTLCLQSEPFGPPKHVACSATQSGNTITIQSFDPNVHLRVTDGQPKLHAGSPFFEVAEYRGRWFLRDGYHRAYAMLRAGITQSPAVIVHARTLEELGAAQPWFFPEDILFSDHPPHIAHFLDDALNIEYTRPALLKTLRVTIEESYAPAPPHLPQGEAL